MHININMKITSDIYQVGGPGLSHSSDAALYLIKSGDEAALVDAGTGKGINRIIENIKKTGSDLPSIKYIFITHCHYDHTGGAGDLRQLAGCSIIAHSLDAKYLEMGDLEVTAASWYGAYMAPLKVDISVNGKTEKFNVGGLDVNFYHAPGHSPGSSVITVNSDGLLVLFGQDVHGPLDSSLLSNRRDYKASLDFLISLNADVLCEGHFGIVRGKDKVRAFIESYL